MRASIYVFRVRKGFVSSDRFLPEDIHAVLVRHVESFFDVLERVTSVSTDELRRCLSSDEFRRLSEFGELIAAGEEGVEVLKCLGINSIDLRGVKYVVLRLEHPS